jgi:restriction system protein
VQCKHWRHRQVGVKVVRELRGAMTDAGAAHGTAVCYGSFTPDAERFAERNKITLVDGVALERMIADVRQSRIARSAAADGAPRPAKQMAPSQAGWDPPLCPVCGSPMVLRTTRKGPHAGSTFWGCPHFPRCRGTRRAQ